MNVVFPTDEELLDRYASGDSSAFEIFFQRHKGRVFNYVMKKVSKPELAAEISQDIFVKLHSKVHLYSTNQPALPWFFTLVHNSCLDALRKIAAGDRLKEQLLQSHRLEAFDENSSESAESQQAAQSSESEQMLRVLRQLPPEQLKVFEARVLEEKSFKTLSVESGKSEVALRKIYSRAVQRIREIIAGKESGGGEL